MSGVLNSGVIDSEEKSFSRRRVVAGVAWSLPVIATAIAAPAAAASPGPSAPVPAAVAIGPVGPAPAAGSSGQLTVQAPTVFDIQTGTAFTGSSVSYTITITVDKSEQNSKVGIASASPGTGNALPVQQGDKATTFTGTLTTTPGDHALRVELGGFSYTKPNKSGTYTYRFDLMVTIGGASLPGNSTLTVTFP